MIDIFIPTYEPNPAHLRAAIDSALAQTEKRWTMFIHDDASQIDVRAMIEKYLADPRITFERSEKRLGIGGNWNACLSRRSEAETDSSAHTTPYIQFLFQDDLWEPLYLETMLKAFEKNPSAGFASADHRYQCDHGMEAAPHYESVRTFRKEKIAPGSHKGSELLRFWIDHELHPNIIGEPSFVMLRRSLIEKTGKFDEAMPQFLDSEYWIRCLQNGDYVSVSDELGAFRVHGKAASAMNQESGAGIYDRLNCFERLISTLPSGELKSATIAARNKALTSMAKKFLARIRSGKKVAGVKNGGFRRFVLSHPLLAAGAFLRSLV